VQKKLFEEKFLGFTVLKDWKGYMEKLEAIMNKPFFTENAEPGYVSSLIKVVRALEMMVQVSRRKLFSDTDLISSEYRVIEGRKMNHDNPKDEYLLFKKTEQDEKGIVIDFGRIKKFNTDRLLTYQKIGGDNFMHWSGSIFELFKSIEVWIENTGNNLILDPLTFRL
jgi:hypothetical protein